MCCVYRALKSLKVQIKAALVKKTGNFRREADIRQMSPIHHTCRQDKRRMFKSDVGTIAVKLTCADAELIIFIIQRFNYKTILW